VSAYDPFRAVADALLSARCVVIGSHVDPDGDAIGSVLGLTLALEAAGRTVYPVLAGADRPPTTYGFLPGIDRLLAAAQAPGCDVFAALDSPSLERLGDAESIARGTDRVIVIDHHPDAVAAGDVALIDPTAPATGVLVWRLLDYLGVMPDAAIATCLYTALVTDTGRFSYSNTTPEALRVGSEMVAAGAVPSEIHTAVYESRSVGAQLLIGRVLARTVLAPGGRTAYSWIEETDLTETGAHADETENLIDHVRALGGVEVVLLAKVHGDTVRGSLRAKGSFDVGAVARTFGGGGHRAAAGFTHIGDLAALLAEVLPMLPGGSR